MQRKIVSLRQLVSAINHEIRRRQKLENNLLSTLFEREISLDIKLLNLRPSGDRIELETRTALEHSLEQVAQQRIQTKETTARDLIDLNKTLWHYWLELEKKQAQLYFLR